MSFLLSRLRRPGRREPTPAHPSPKTEQGQLQIDRKILENPDALLDSDVQDPVPLGLTPSTRLRSAGGRNHPKPADRPPERDPVDISPRTPVFRTAAGGEWSTFGRKRQAPDTSLPESPKKPSHPQSPTGGSTFTLSRVTRPSQISTGTHDRTSSPSTGSPQQSPDVHSGSPSSTDTTSSKRHPRTPQRPLSYTAPASLATSGHRERVFDSPHTFGHPTPPPDKYPSSPPPLPPLDHPGLATRTNPIATGQHTVFRDRSNTLPTKRRTPRKDELFPSLSLRLGRSIQHPSVRQARRVFGTAMAKQQERPPDERRRARTISGGARRRRTSADWSAHQAAVGVNSRANQAWPAEVSREILKLSLFGHNGSQGSPTTRGRDADPVRCPDPGVSSPALLPFPHPPRPSSPPPLRASATLTDGRAFVSLPRPHSLPFNLGNHRGGEQPERFTMAEVKRSLSVIEARKTPNNRRASGAAYASSGLGNPAPTSSDAPRASLASTPLRSLLPGRVSPISMSSSIQGEPSTPTPEPRHQSDKSRGKRKAEDNLEVTPPEQKKEGQRATFLLPSESRSQRVSGSSHAPSSYHRKRARLSSTSPFATPVQSRPTSVRETLQSAGHSHYFTSLSSSTGAPFASRTPSRAASTRSRQPPTPSTTGKHERRQSISQVSIPISAYISPHAPSISRSTKFHMRDPRKPPKKPDDTLWGLRFTTEDEPGSPIQAWCFFFGFLLFPLWWIAGLLLHVPTTRIAGDVDAEKGVPIDDPQIEHDAKIWRFRCRVMTIVSLFTYIPFIVLVVIFAPR